MFVQKMYKDKTHDQINEKANTSFICLPDMSQVLYSHSAGAMHSFCKNDLQSAVSEIPFGRLYNEQVASMKSSAQTSAMPGCGIAARMISCEWSCL